VDVGTPDDERFLRGGSFPENWGNIPADSFGATQESVTVRWTPGTGGRISLTLPVSPGRDHVLRLRGRPFRDNPLQVLVGDRLVQEVMLSGNFRVYEVPVPERFLRGRRLARVVLFFPKPMIPQRVDPEHFPNEPRACNFGLDWAQWSTDNVGISREQNFTMPQERLALASPSGTVTAPAGEIPVQPSEYETVAAPRGARVLSRYQAGDCPRDIALRCGQGEVLYVNGLLSDTQAPAYWDRLLSRWAGQRTDALVSGPDVIGCRLSAGDTELLLAYNYGGERVAPVQARVGVWEYGSVRARTATHHSPLTTHSPTPTLPHSHTPTLPVASVRALARDGKQWQMVPYRVENGQVRFSDQIGYYAIYEVARGPVRVSWPNPALQPGEARSVAVRLENLTAQAVRGKLSLEGYVPTVRAETAAFSLPPRGKSTVALKLRVDPRAEWGHRTVVLRVDANGRRCSLWQPLVVERNPDLRLEASFPAPGQAQVTVNNAANPYIGTAAASGMRVLVAGQELDFGTLAAGQSRGLPVSFPASAVKAAGAAVPDGAAPRLGELPVRLTYRSRGLRWKAPRSVPAPVLPEAFPRLAGADGVIVVCNPADRPVDGETVSLGRAPETPVHVREAGGHVVPSQVTGGELHALVSIRPHSALTLYRCSGTAPASASDLQIEKRDLGTGQGSVTLRNTRVSLTLDEAAGGVVTSLVSAATGCEYGMGSFGATEGVFGKPDPLRPALTTVEYVKDQRKGLEPGARIEVEAEGPLFAAVKVTSRLGARAVSTRYVLPAHSAAFEVERVVEPAAATAGAVTATAGAEVVALDVTLRRNAIAKIFPNFTGVFETPEQPHFGWREGAHVPSYASMMAPNDFRESVSFVLHSQEGIARFRQGIWPKQRPKPGPAENARLEYIAAPGARRASLALTVMLHPGHPRIARRRLEEPAPYAIPIPQPQWAGERTAAEMPADWHLPYHHRRAPLTVTGPTEAGQWLGVALAAGMPADADYRLVALEGAGAREIPVRVAPGADALGWQTDGGEAGRRYLLYFDRRAGGTDLALPARTPPAGRVLLDPSFEESPSAWHFNDSKVIATQTPAGARALCLDCRKGAKLAVAVNDTLALRPDGTYRVTFRARAEGGPATVRTNFYDVGYDFPQLGLVVQPGDWREYTATLATGSFPPGVRPALRFWVLDAGQCALVDDVRVEWLGERADKAAGARVELGSGEVSGGQE